MSFWDSFSDPGLEPSSPQPLIGQDAMAASPIPVHDLSAVNSAMISVLEGLQVERNVTGAQIVWQRLANAGAKFCMPGGVLDIQKAQQLQRFWDQVDPKSPPWNNVPSIEWVKTQNLYILGKLVVVPSGLATQFTQLQNKSIDYKDFNQNSYWNDFLTNMNQPEAQPLLPQVAILQSLLTPHRQISLPTTCSIHAIINVEIFDHTEALFATYVDLLQAGPNSEISFGYCRPRSQMLIQPFSARIPFSVEIRPENPLGEDNQRSLLVADKLTGQPDITPLANDGNRIIGFAYRVYNLNDLFCAMLVNRVYAGNGTLGSGVTASNTSNHIRRLYFEDVGTFLQLPPIQGVLNNITVDNITVNAYVYTKENIAALIGALSNNGYTQHDFATVSTRESRESPSGHEENIYPKVLCSSNFLDTMKDNEQIEIGDRITLHETGEVMYLCLSKLSDDQFIFETTFRNGNTRADTIVLYQLGQIELFKKTD
jgi:hypothetical protein